MSSRSDTAAADGSTAEYHAIGWTPESGKSHADTATTATGGNPTRQASPRRPVSHKAAATSPRNRPATALAAVASAAISTTTTARSRGRTGGPAGSSPPVGQANTASRV